MPLTNGHYRTDAGSTVVISGDHAGIHDIWFDWFEEKACIESKPSVDVCSERLVWQCKCHGCSDAPLRQPNIMDEGAEAAE